MKPKLSRGSALLLVFIVSFVVSLAAIRCWHVSSLMCDVQYQRELFYKRFYLTNRILDAGIDLACKNFDTFLKLKKTTDVATSVDVNFCLTDDEIKNANVARLTVSKFVLKTRQILAKQALSSQALSSQVLASQVLARSVHQANLDLGAKAECLLLSASLVINNEIVCNLRCLLERSKNGNGTSFVVTHFTLSSSL